MKIKYFVTKKGRKKYRELKHQTFEVVNLSEIDDEMIETLSILEEDGCIVAEITMEMFKINNI